MYFTWTKSQTRSTFTMTRAKYNKNPKLTREQWIQFFKQQTMQVAMLMQALDQAYEKIRMLEAQKNEREEQDVDKDENIRLEEKINNEKMEEEDDGNECEDENIRHNYENKFTIFFLLQKEIGGTLALSRCLLLMTGCEAF